MVTTEAPAGQGVVVERLTRSHAQRLGVHEQFVAAVRGGQVDRVQPGAVFAALGPLGRKMGQSLGEDVVQHRQNQVNLFLHRKGMTQVPFVETKIGYTLALTEKRVLVFNLAGRRFLSQSSIKALRLETVTHTDGAITLLFCERRKCAAITAWDRTESVEHFVNAYRDAQKVLHQRR